MSICAAVASAFGVQLVLQQPCLAQSQTLASLDNLSIEQVVTRGTSVSNIGSNNFRTLTAPNLTHLLSQGDTSPNEQWPSTGQPSLDPQNLLPVTPDTPVPSTSGLSPEAGPSVPSAASPTTPSAPEDPQKTEEEQRKSLRKTRRSRIKELEDTRLELAEKQLKLIEREKELLDKDQTVSTLREELDLERKLRALLTKEKDKAEEEAALAMGLCTGAFTLP